MKTISSILPILMIIFIGCSATSTYLIKHDQSTYDELNKKLKAEKGKMVLMNGDIIFGEDINIGHDSTSWIEKGEPLYPGAPERGSLKKSVATSEINYFTFINRGKGALAGARNGFLAGAAAGAVRGFTLIGEKGVMGKKFTAEILFSTVPLGGVAGAIIGLPIGLIVGGTDEYIFTEMPKDSLEINK